VSTVLVSYENNDDSMNATADALNGKQKSGEGFLYWSMIS
jgi:hypothetical protein